MRFRFVSLTAAFAFLSSGVLTHNASAENWPNWRGPSYNGSTTETGLPTEFSTTKNVRWTADIGGQGASTPVVWGDKIFLTSATNNEADPTGTDGMMRAVCIDAKSGDPSWQIELTGRTMFDNRSNTASPSAATDGKTVVFFFGDGTLLATDLNGGQLWQTRLTPKEHYFSFLWTFASSPLLLDGKIYLPILQRDNSFNQNGIQRGPKGAKDNQSYLLCINAADGKELWRANRPSKAVAESLEAFGTVTPHEVDGKTQLIIAGGDCLTGHDPSDGKELWRWGTWNPERIGHWRLVPTPVAGAGVVVIPAPKKAPVFAVKLGGSGDLGKDGLAWQSDEDEATSDVSSALFYQGRFYLVDGDRREKALVCLDPKNGKTIWRGSLETKSKMEAAATGADGKIYMVDHGGKVFVAQAGGDEFKLLHQVDMGDRANDPARSPVVAANGALLIRMGSKLYCIGN